MKIWIEAFVIMCIFVAIASFAYSNLTNEVVAKDTKDPVALSADTTIELIATMEDGKVRVYRLTDHTRDPFLSSVCYITVGELHGKTVATECK